MTYRVDISGLDDLIEAIEEAKKLDDVKEVVKNDTAYMANQIAGVTDKLIKYATEEFLQHGFQEASLRTIAEKAQTSTKSIYIRFNDKKGLFDAIINSAVNEFKELYISSISDFEENYSDVTYEDMFEYSDKYINNLIDCIYDNYNAFRLLICYSDGVTCADFINSIAELEAEETIRYMKKNSCTTFSPELIHMLSTAYISGLFEIVRHEMSRSEAKNHSAQLKDFFRAGWINIFNK